jgi:hypothetical protein
VEHSGGNPLFAEQLLAVASELPGISLDQAPPTVEALIASRLDRLPASELDVLQRASVLGRRFAADGLDDVALAAVERRGFVRATADGFRFHHVLVRDVAYRSISKARRAGLHETAASLLDRHDAVDEVVGFHLEQAYRYRTELAREDEHARVLANAAGHRLGDAGIRAWKRADASAAAGLLRRAVDLLPEDDAKRLELLCELGLVLRTQGNITTAQQCLRDVMSAASDPAVNVALRARIELQGIRALEHGTGVSELLETIDRTIPQLERAGDARALARAWLTKGIMRGSFEGTNDALETAATKAVRYYRRGGWSPSTAIGYLASALYYGPRPVPRAISRCEDLLVESAGDLASEANIRVWLGALRAMRREFGAARSLVDSARSAYQDLGWTFAAEGTCGLVEGAIEMLALRADRAEPVLREACEAAERYRELAWLSSRAAELAEALYVQSKFDEAEGWIGVSRRYVGTEDRDAQSSWMSVQAKLDAQAGSPGRAEALVRSALELAAQTDALNHRAKISLDAAEVLRLAGKDAAASEAVASAVSLFRSKGNLVAAERAGELLTASLTT